LLTPEERKDIIRQVVKMTRGRIPVFFGATFPTTEDSVRSGFPWACRTTPAGWEWTWRSKRSSPWPGSSSILSWTKAALRVLGLPAGGIRRPYPELEGEKLVELKEMMAAMGVVAKYGQR
jgi:4-hydroxy-tetrahydrodipicolinate synthase